jgi:hypothetical protein
MVAFAEVVTVADTDSGSSLIVASNGSWAGAEGGVSVLGALCSEFDDHRFKKLNGD